MAPPAQSARSEDNPPVSPPTYSLEEDDQGNLVTYKYNLTWPQRPKTGRYSVADEVAKGKVRGRAQQQQAQWKTKTPQVRAFDSRITVVEDEDEPVATVFKMKFSNQTRTTEFVVRAIKTESVNKHFNQYQRRSMVLYYRMPDLSGKRKTISAIPLNLPLTVASHVAECGAPKPTEIVHSEVQRYSHKNDNGGEDFLWCLAKLGPDGEPEKLASGVYRLGFVDLRSLLEYYATTLIKMPEDCEDQGHEPVGVTASASDDDE